MKYSSLKENRTSFFLLIQSITPSLLRKTRSSRNLFSAPLVTKYTQARIAINFYQLLAAARVSSIFKELNMIKHTISELQYSKRCQFGQIMLGITKNPSYSLKLSFKYIRSLVSEYAGTTGDNFCF